MDRITIDTEYIKLDQLLKWAGIVGSGTDAKMLVTDGMVEVNGTIVQQRGKKIYPGDTIVVYLEREVKFTVE